MNFKLLLNMQEKLDNRIEEQFVLENEDLINNKILALLVEVGELANETKCFKYWSIKDSSEKSVILEEYVDVLHFILSIGLSLNYGPPKNKIDSSQDSRNNLTKSFLELFQVIHLFQLNKDKATYSDIFEKYISLGLLLGFSKIEIEQAYIRKNKINHNRQQQGY